MLKYYSILFLFTSTFSVVGSCIKLNYCKTKQNKNFQKRKAVVFNGLFDKGWAMGSQCRLEWMRNQYFNQHVSVHHSGDLCSCLSCSPPKAASFNRSLHWDLNNNNNNSTNKQRVSHSAPFLKGAGSSLFRYIETAVFAAVSYKVYFCPWMSVLTYILNIGPQ